MSLARYDCPEIEAAQAIILTDEAGLSSAERWERETAWLLPRLVFKTGPVLDFGCGVGRLAKHIAGPSLPVTGIDSSSEMRRHAVRYVNSDHFRVGGTEDLDRWLMDGWRCQGVICAWVLQHVLEPRLEIARIAAAARSGAHLYLLNRDHRCVPAGEDGWRDDEFNILSALGQRFRIESVEPVPESLCVRGAYLSQWRKV